MPTSATQSAVAQALDGAQAAVNAVGLYVESGADRFEAVHESGALNLARQASHPGARPPGPHLRHRCGPDVDFRLRPGASPGRAVDAEGVLPRPQSCAPAFSSGRRTASSTAWPPSPGRTPVLPLFGRGDTLLQPVYVGDVAEATLRALQHPAAAGEVYELGGPQIYSYRALIELVLQQSRRRCRSAAPALRGLAGAGGARLCPAPAADHDRAGRADEAGQRRR